MNRTVRPLLLGCLLLASSLPALAGGNSLLVPANARCVLDLEPPALPDALRLCEQAALGGDLQAAFELGEFYHDGRRAPRDLAKALKWFEQASLHGHALAQHRLGVMFFRGEGVPASNVQAYIVLKMAAVNGDESALDTADRVSTQMRRDELEIATQVLGQVFRNYLLDLQVAD
ncbi:tetratricopeptide repeat protein [Stutzerimonas kirkiae]|uniref:Sel1 repeat family protein n=1 Tax=Stutzerimonas kirkiae TaxID=2211392 RepID=A0A4V2KBZ4_9GAMM|nr:tetratricopeptide repeat protein [Stutzerimonas kirkiae]TBU90075.1 sel1 repeat family protein [Stutzerimonas kirkiae]TBU99065.1 sel1 repeat family protein [Stutzerimonas kirkiae]TBV10200.1 sel1 repeat family protein [Stutzerimonas kirkiae]TBV11639.1 sel1 repeat family protein [Stutzerimonas kirkiae]